MRVVRRTALLFTAVYAFGLLSGHSGHADAVPVTPVPGPAASPSPVSGAPSLCRGKDLPRTAPARTALADAAQAVAVCLGSAAATTSRPRAVTVRAEALTVTGLRCGLPPRGDGACHADGVTLEDVRIHYQGPTGRAGSCTSARHVAFSHHVRFRADVLHGRVFGLLPLTLSTAAIPAVPLPYLRLTHVHASGLWARADHALTARTTISPEPAGAGSCLRTGTADP